MSRTIEEAIGFLTSVGGDEAHEHHEAFASCLAQLLLDPDAGRIQPSIFRKALAHGFAYYFWKWDPRGKNLMGPLTAAMERVGQSSPLDVELMCEMLDFAYFIAWCFEASNTAQCDLYLPAAQIAAASFAADAAATRHPAPSAGSQRIAWLAMFAASNDAMSIPLRQSAAHIAALGHSLDVYCWRFFDQAFVAELEAAGARVHDVRRDGAEPAIAAIEALAACHRPTVMISDMNNAVPTAIFARRQAPVQIFLQAGMPAWPVPNLDAVFNSFGFNPALAGWGHALMLDFSSQWHIESLNPTIDPQTVAAERALLPQSKQLIGAYGRLVKVTEAYLKAAEAILLQCPDAAFAVGGTGDADLIRNFIAGSPVGARMHLEARFCPGHAWGHVLDLMLDTWPVTGGELCREMIAKGKPVVTLHSDEMPALDRQRDHLLIASDWNEYVAKASKLLNDPADLLAARGRALKLAQRFADPAIARARLGKDIDRAVQTVRRRSSRAERLYAAMRIVTRQDKASRAEN